MDKSTEFQSKSNTDSAQTVRIETNPSWKKAKANYYAVKHDIKNEDSKEAFESASKANVDGLLLDTRLFRGESQGPVIEAMFDRPSYPIPFDTGLDSATFSAPHHHLSQNSTATIQAEAEATPEKPLVLSSTINKDTAPVEKADQRTHKWMIVVHGGAGMHIPNSAHITKYLNEAMRSAAIVLKNPDGDAEQAVVAALTVLEQNSRFNCGFGSPPGLEGQIEQDAMIIDRYGRSGAIAAAPGIANAITVADAVRRASLEPDSIRVRASCLAGQGATDFAHKAGLRIYRNIDLVSEPARHMCNVWRQRLGLPGIDWETGKPEPHSAEAPLPMDSSISTTPIASSPILGPTPLHTSYGIQDTVGVMILDNQGNLACGCSSGGPGLKDSGRIGPAAVQGAGAAMNFHPFSGLKTAVLASGSGETIRSTMASSVASERLFYGQSVDENMRLSHCPENAILPLYIRNEFLITKAHPSVLYHPSNNQALGLVGIRVMSKNALVSFAFTSKFFSVGSFVEGEKAPSSQTYTSPENELQHIQGGVLTEFGLQHESSTS